jgi:hypothetical protein
MPTGIYPRLHPATREQRCYVRTAAGRCKESAVRLITINGARVWVCRDCYEAVEMHDAQPIVVDQVTGIWITIG